MFNNELVLINAIKTISNVATHTITVGEWIDYDELPNWGYSKVPDIPEFGSINPRHFNNFPLLCLLVYDDGAENKYVKFWVDAALFGNVYIVRLDKNFGVKIYYDGIGEGDASIDNNYLFVSDDVGKEIPFYISQTPPPFDWTEV